ncbi:hypothetical protein MPDQ_008053 [Monascus purpureus]|uniref:Uncharacterized protein n=1 Tax=Monascus purpureus TaxID=5098 RepID=A0A507QQV8_MONPU|nr:hypothetical protein MPDQ_008053 [Monascus purpureus]
MASQFARTTPTGHYLEEWPALPVFQEAKTVHVDISGWMQRRCPPELKEISINVPDVVVSVVRESARNERFLKRAGDLGINPSIGPRSLIEPWDRKRPCPCAPDQLPFAEDSPTAGYILATLEYAEGTAEWEASEDQRQPSSEVMHSQETEESCAPDPHRILLIDGLVRNLQAHLSEVNRLQQLSLINRQKEQVLKFLSSQQQSHHGASSFIGKLQRCLEPCIRQRTSAHGTSRFEHTRMKFPFLSGKEDVRVIKSAQRCLVQELVYDRMWFDQVVAERENMLKRYRLGLINSGSDVEEISFIHGQDGIHEM